MLLMPRRRSPILDPQCSILDPQSSILIVLGLGNPGHEYDQTRHNLGFMVVDRFAAVSDLAIRKRKFHALCCEGVAEGRRVVLLKPLTFVNASGLTASEALRHFKVAPSSLLVVCDDLNLPTGKIRVRREGAAGGHHGLESIIERLGTRAFPRLRIGISHPGQRGKAVTGHVLSRFHPEEQQIVDEAIGRAVEAVTLWLRDGLDAAMRKVNGE